MKTRLILLLCLMLCLTGAALSEAAYPAWMQAHVSDEFAYSVDDMGRATVLDCLKHEEEFWIPPEIDGHPVVAVEGLAFLNRNSTTRRLGLSEGIERLHASALSDLSALRSVMLPYSLKEFLHGNTNRALEFIVPEGHPVFAVIEGSLYDKQTKTLLSYGGDEYYVAVQPGIEHIGPYAFANSEALGVALPEGLKTIGIGAFINMYRLQKLNLPESLTQINDLILSGTNTDAQIVYTRGSYADHWVHSMADIFMPEHGMGRGDPD